MPNSQIYAFMHLCIALESAIFHNGKKERKVKPPEDLTTALGNKDSCFGSRLWFVMFILLSWSELFLGETSRQKLYLCVESDCPSSRN